MKLLLAFALLFASVDAQLAKLDSHDPVVRAEGARELGEMGEQAAPAAPRLIEMLEDTVRLPVNPDDFPPGRPVPNHFPNPKEVREAAETALVKIGDPAVEALIKALDEQIGGRAQAQARALARMGEKARPAIPSLVKALTEARAELSKSYSDASRTYDWVVTCEVTVALGRIGAVPELRDLLVGKDWMRAEAAAWGLAYAGPKGAGPLLDIIEDPSWKSRRLAVHGLGRVADAPPDATQALRKAAKDSKVWEVRAAALLSLGRAGDVSEEGLAVILEGVKDKVWNVRQAAGEGLLALGERAASLAPAATVVFRSEKVPEVRGYLAAALVAMGSRNTEFVPALAHVLQFETRRHLRLTALDALEKLGPSARPAALAVKKLLDDENDEIKERARVVLAAISG